MAQGRYQLFKHQQLLVYLKREQRLSQWSLAFMEVAGVTHHRWHLSVNVTQHDIVLRLYSS